MPTYTAVLHGTQMIFVATMWVQHGLVKFINFLMLTVIKKMQRDILIGLAVALGVVLLGLVGFLVYRAIFHKGSGTGGCNPVCGSHGTCNAKSKSCTCDPGWYGSACQHSSGGDISPPPEPSPTTSPPDDPGGTYATHQCTDVAAGGNTKTGNPTTAQKQFAQQATAYCVSKSKNSDAYCRTDSGTCHAADGVNCCVSPVPV